MEIEQVKESQYDELFEMMLTYSSEYLQGAITKLGISVEQFKELFKTIGTIYVIYVDKDLAGFFWIERREEVLHIHALIIRASFRVEGLARRFYS